MPAKSSPLLSAPIVPTLARLAAPGIALALFQTAVSVADTYFVGQLGTEALAGLALVFPMLMLLQMTSAGAMGGGVSSAVARALGAGDRDAARRLVAHALIIALGGGIAFTVLLLGFGRGLYGLLGGRGAALEQALAYSDVLFGAAVLAWIANTLASLLRGSGNTLAPALAYAGTALVQIPLSGALTLGWAPFPRLGIAGAAVAYAAAFALASLAMAVLVWRSKLRPQPAHLRLEGRLFREILRVGAISSLSSLQTVFTAVVLTGFVARFGTAALAGYGVGVRLELLQIPIVFAISQALVVMVGTHIGAGQAARAKRIAWTGTAASALICLVIGGTVAIHPALWVRIFSEDAAVLEIGSMYMRIVAPLYPVFGAGLALYFASQGAGRMVAPVLAGTVRLAVVVAGGALVMQFGGPLSALFGVVSLGLALLGGLTGYAVYKANWSRA
ncbi:MAG: MATE family efflux transporter [Burkholderiales bacterium]|nr:MATE family efflux transporter [Burkholderiales bacterium]